MQLPMPELSEVLKCHNYTDMPQQTLFPKIHQFGSSLRYPIGNVPPKFFKELQIFS